MRLVETAQAESKQRVVLCDLNWTRLDRVRMAIAQFFDHQASHHHFGEIDSVRIDIAPGFKSTGLLLAGWLAAQLDWRAAKSVRGDRYQFLDKDGREIAVESRERGTEPVSEVFLRSGGVEFRVTHAKCGDLLEVSRAAAGEEPMPQVMPAQSNDPVGLMTQELLRGGPHRVYLRAARCVRDWL
jgi:glucose-6-phosphate dehydrogenase assembly protein OpcA